MEDVKLVLEESPWKHAAPRLYLDTCMLADMFLEDRVQTIRDPRDYERWLAQTLSSRWPVQFVTSPYVIGELFRIGGKDKFSRNSEEIREILMEKVYPKCTVVFAKWNLTPEDAIKTLESIGYESKTIVDMEYHGAAVWESYRAENATGWLRIVKTDSSISKLTSVMAGLPLDHPYDMVPLDAQFKDIDRLTVKVPAVELLFFEQAAHWVHELGVSWSDAFHFLYADWSNCDYIMTTDGPLVKKCSDKKYHGPKALNPSKVVSRLPRGLLREVFQQSQRRQEP